MEPFRNFAGIAAPMPQVNIDTDAIIPSPWLRSPRADLAHGLFARWRYDANDVEREEFILNREPYRRATILVAGENFGCGSSREAAVWALMRFGIRCVAAPSFADIFYENAFRNGLLPAILPASDIARLTTLSMDPTALPVCEVDLPGGTITGPDGNALPFRIPPNRREQLLRGEDQIEQSLAHEAAIAAFEENNRHILRLSRASPREPE